MVAKANKEWIKNAVVNPDKVNILKLVARDHKDLKVVHKASKARVANKALRAEETRTHLADKVNNVRVDKEVTWKRKKVDLTEAEVKVEAKVDSKVTEALRAEIKADPVHQAVNV
ncbi:MAG TPA: hypothetical protein VJT83_08710 [Chitinophagaceae bacterium]|nr:hypothetical protein [Chitinophagaceae bacterium]